MLKRCRTAFSDDAASAEFGKHPLDHVIWRALTGVQRRFAEGDEGARRYPAAVAPFAATIDWEPVSLNSLLTLIGTGDDRIALFTPEELSPSSEFSIARRDAVDQMVLVDANACAPPSTTVVTQLSEVDVPEMLALASLTQPGPFGPRTVELGDYWGLRREGVLVAMAGERMRLDGFTEISAVCVHPAYRGQGFAADLVRLLVTSIVARAETPFLHVFSSNTAAIALYQKLGFALRRQMHLLVLDRATSAAADGLPRKT
jgi:ribosomal protein S18 acetylase RimI-like enzyme